MKLSITVIAMTALSLTACVTNRTTQWVAAPYASISLEQADAECRFEAEKGAPMMDLNANVFSQAASQNDIFRKCMKAKGYSQEIVEVKPKVSK